MGPDQLAGRELALDVFIRSNLLSYAVYAKERQLVRLEVISLPIPLEENIQPFHEWVKGNDWFSMHYSHTTVVCNDASMGLIPSEIVEQVSPENLSRYLFEHTRFERLEQHDCGDKKLIYPMADSIYYAQRSRFPGASLQHAAGRILNWACDSTIPPAFIVVNHGDYLQVILREGEKLQFAQSFPFLDTEEAVYHVLNTMERLDINRQSNELRTIGVDPESALFLGLQEFVREVKPYTLPLPDALLNQFQLHPMLISLL